MTIRAPDPIAEERLGMTVKGGAEAYRLDVMQPGDAKAGDVGFVGGSCPSCGEPGRNLDFGQFSGRQSQGHFDGVFGPEG